MMKRLGPLVFLSILFIGMGLCVGVGLSGPARAQSDDINQLYHEIERLRTDLRDMQAYVFSGDSSAGTPEEAAVSSSETRSSARLAADLEYRMGLVDEQFRMMTGQFEEIGHRMLLLEQRIEKLVADMDFRLGELERSVAASANAPTPAATATQAGEQTAYPSVDDLVEGSPAMPSEPVAILPTGTDQEQYEFALAQVRTMQQSAGTAELERSVDGAQRALEEFIARNPDSALIDNASYWLGEVHYFVRDYERAVVIFARNYEKQPTGRKARENLLKLAMSLANLDRASDACQALREVRAKFPNGSESLTRRVDAQWFANACQ